MQRNSFSGKLKLAFTSPDVISTSPKSFSSSRIDFTLLLLFEFLKEHHLPVGQVKNRFHYPDSKIHLPRAIGHYFLCTLRVKRKLMLVTLWTTRIKKDTTNDDLSQDLFVIVSLRPGSLVGKRQMVNYSTRKSAGKASCFLYIRPVIRPFSALKSLPGPKLVIVSTHYRGH